MCRWQYGNLAFFNLSRLIRYWGGGFVSGTKGSWGSPSEIIPASQEDGNDRVIWVSAYSASLPAHHCKLMAQPLPDRIINASPCNGHTKILKMLHGWANLPAQDLLCTISSPREASPHRSKGRTAVCTAGSSSGVIYVCLKIISFLINGSS